MLAQVSCCRGACSDSRGIAFLRGVHEAPAMALRCCKGAAYARAVLTTPAPCEHEGAYLGVHVSCDCMRSYVPGDVATSALQQVFQATPSWVLASSSGSYDVQCLQLSPGQVAFPASRGNQWDSSVRWPVGYLRTLQAHAQQVGSVSLGNSSPAFLQYRLHR